VVFPPRPEAEAGFRWIGYWGAQKSLPAGRQALSATILLRQAAFALGYEAISEKQLLRSRERKHHDGAERHQNLSNLFFMQILSRLSV